jgi:hypothetical protein
LLLLLQSKLRKQSIYCNSFLFLKPSFLLGYQFGSKTSKKQTKEGKLAKQFSF